MFKKYVLKVLAVAATCFIVSSAGATPVKWSDNGHYYDAITQDTNWDDAKLTAESLVFNGQYGQLATITSLAENLWITNTFPQLQNVGFLRGYWVGGYQLDSAPEPAGGWTWITGEPWNYSNWFPGEPNDWASWAGNDENRLQIGGGFNSDGLQWNDLNNTNITNGFVVEYPVPEPASLLLLGSGLVCLGGLKKKTQPAVI